VIAAQLLSREPRVFIRPNVRGTLVAIEKSASHSVSLFTIILWGARFRFERIWLSYWIHSSLFFHFASSITIITIITTSSILFTLKSGSLRASDTIACHARRERESAEVAKAAFQSFDLRYLEVVQRVGPAGTTTIMRAIGQWLVADACISHGQMARG